MTRGQGRTVALAAVLLVTASALAACSGGSDGKSGKGEGKDDAATAACKAPPVTMQLQALGEPKAGAKKFEVTDGVARRTAILPGKMAFDAAALSTLEKEAAVTPLAMYTIYLADYEIPRDIVKGTVTGRIDPGEGETIGAVTLVPSSETGLKEGDVLKVGKIDYETRTMLSPLTVTVYADGDPTAQAYTKVSGQAEILALDKKTMCVDLDITMENLDVDVYTVKGTIEVPVVRSSNAIFVN